MWLVNTKSLQRRKTEGKILENTPIKVMWKKMNPWRLLLIYSFIHFKIFIECVYYVPGIGDTIFNKIKDGCILKEIITKWGDTDKMKSIKSMNSDMES